jgi:hypothetical protein
MPWIAAFIRALKRGLRDEHGLEPAKVVGKPPDEDLFFDSVPDGEYPMVIDGHKEKLVLQDGAFTFFGEERRVCPPKKQVEEKKRKKNERSDPGPTP